MSLLHNNSDVCEHDLHSGQHIMHYNNNDGTDDDHKLEDITIPTTHKSNIQHRSLRKGNKKMVTM